MLCTKKDGAELGIVKLREKHRVQVEALEKEMSDLNLENQRLREKSRVQEEVSDARARDSQEQDPRRKRLEIDDENPDDGSTALIVSPISSSDTDSFDALLPFEDERLCERSLVQEDACNLIFLRTMLKKEKEIDSLLTNGERTSSLKQLLTFTMMLSRPILLLKKSVAFKWFVPGVRRGGK